MSLQVTSCRVRACVVVMVPDRETLPHPPPPPRRREASLFVAVRLVLYVQQNQQPLGAGTLLGESGPCNNAHVKLAKMCALWHMALARQSVSGTDG